MQFGITDLAITQYDANGFAHPVNLRHTVLVPGHHRILPSRTGIWAPSCSAGRAAHRAREDPLRGVDGAARRRSR